MRLAKTPGWELVQLSITPFSISGTPVDNRGRAFGAADFERLLTRWRELAPAGPGFVIPGRGALVAGGVKLYHSDAPDSVVAMQTPLISGQVIWTRQGSTFAALRAAILRRAEKFLTGDFGTGPTRRQRRAVVEQLRRIGFTAAELFEWRAFTVKLWDTEFLEYRE